METQSDVRRRAFQHLRAPHLNLGGAQLSHGGGGPVVPGSDEGQVSVALRDNGARFCDRAPSVEPQAAQPHGDLADVKWDENVLLVRRSQTVGDEAVERLRPRSARSCSSRRS